MMNAQFKTFPWRLGRQRGDRRTAWIILFSSFLSLLPVHAEEYSAAPFPAFNVVVPTVAGHPVEDNREGPLHGETHLVPPHQVGSLIDRLYPALPKVPDGEPVEFSFYLSKAWTDEEKRLVELMKRSLQPRFPANPLTVELHHPRVPRWLKKQIPRPGTDDILLALKNLEETAPTRSDKLVLETVRRDIENAQPVSVETDEESEFPRRLQRPENARYIVNTFAVIRALITGGMFYHALHYPELEATTKAMWAWSIIIGRASIDFGTSAFAQSFGELLAKHELPKIPGVSEPFWNRLNDWYTGRANPETRSRTEIIKQGVYNYLIFTLLLCPFTQWAASHADKAEPMNWGYFAWTAALCAVATVAFVKGADGLRKLRQMGVKSGAAIDMKYGFLSLVGAVSDVANAVPALGVVRYFTMGFVGLVQLLDARRAAREKPKVNRYVFIDSSLPDIVRTGSIVPLENINDTRRFGREVAGEDPSYIKGKVEDFVYWTLQGPPQLPGTQSMLCAEAMLLTQ